MKIYNPKVSVIIPIYNTSEYLRECMDSVLNQSLKEIEIICVDDGSTDGSLEILLDYQNHDDRVTVLSQKNSGAGVARNKGLSIARGEYLAFLDSDDFFKPDMLEKAYLRGIETKADIVMFRFHRFDNNENKEYDLPHMMNKNNFPDKDVFSARDFDKNFYMVTTGWTWDKLFLKKYIDKINLKFQDVRIYNDMYFTYSAIAAAKSITYFTDALVCQRVNRKGAISKSVQDYWYCIFQALFSVKEFLISKNLIGLFYQHYVQYAAHMLLFSYRQLDDSTKNLMRICLKYFGVKALGLNLDNENNFISNKEFDEFKSIIEGNDNVSIPPQNIEKKTLFTIFRGGIRCIKDHGIVYTIKLLFKKIIHRA